MDLLGRAAIPATFEQAIRDQLIEHKRFIARYGDDMPEITGWRWGAGSGVRRSPLDRGGQRLTVRRRA
jgi:xylulose-5-phosphate/fructose-6-phosphate phosphoketolase